jgi:putative DNA primase/helicase
MIDAERIPPDLCRRPQWVCWRRELRDGRETKVPYRADGRGRASATNPATWSSFAAALCAYRTGAFAGIGFVLSADDPFTAIDLDHAVDEDGVTAPWAAEIIAILDSFTELSPSGRGYRIFVRGALPTDGNKRGDVEMYDRARYLTVTGRHVAGTPTTIEQRDDALRAVHERFVGGAPQSEPAPGIHCIRCIEPDDHELVARAIRAANGNRFARLWSGDVSAYGSHSEADLALCSLLAFWTRGDSSRMDRLFRASGLMRPKWDERRGRQTFGELTIARALR